MSHAWEQLQPLRGECGKVVLSIGKIVTAKFHAALVLPRLSSIEASCEIPEARRVKVPKENSEIIFL